MFYVRDKFLERRYYTAFGMHIDQYRRSRYFSDLFHDIIHEGSLYNDLFSRGLAVCFSLEIFSRDFQEIRLNTCPSPGILVTLREKTACKQTSISTTTSWSDQSRYNESNLVCAFLTGL